MPAETTNPVTPSPKLPWYKRVAASIKATFSSKPKTPVTTPAQKQPSTTSTPAVTNTPATTPDKNISTQPEKSNWTKFKNVFTPSKKNELAVTNTPAQKKPTTIAMPVIATPQEKDGVVLKLEDIFDDVSATESAASLVESTQPKPLTSTSSDNSAVTTATEQLVTEITVNKVADKETEVKETTLQQSVDMAEKVKQDLLAKRQLSEAKTALVTEIVTKQIEAQKNETDTPQAELVSTEQATSQSDQSEVKSSDTSSLDQIQIPSPTNKSATKDFAIGAGKGTLYGLAGIGSVFAAAFVGFSIDAAIVGAPFLAGCFATLNFIIALAPIAAAVLLAVALTVGFIEMYRSDDKSKKIQNQSDLNAKNMTGNSTELATKKLNTVTVSPKLEQLSSDKALVATASTGNTSGTGMFSSSEAANDSKKYTKVENQHGCSMM
jgi:hypothetical protein